MSVLESPCSVRSSTSDLDELEDAFLAWAHGPAKPDVVDLGVDGTVSMAELSRQLADSQATLPASACTQLGMPPGATFATAAAELLHATVDADGPRCRWFRAASYYLRGLIRLDDDLQRATCSPGSFSTGNPRGNPDVR